MSYNRLLYNGVHFFVEFTQISPHNNFIVKIEISLLCGDLLTTKTKKAVAISLAFECLKEKLN